MQQPMQAHEIAERAAEARAIINSEVMKQVFDELQAEYVQQLIHADVGGLTASTAHASMKVLADVQGRLKTYINDELMRRKRS